MDRFKIEFIPFKDDTALDGQVELQFNSGEDWKNFNWDKKNAIEKEIESILIKLGENPDKWSYVPTHPCEAHHCKPEIS